MNIENNIQRVVSQAEAIVESSNDVRSRNVVFPQDFVNSIGIILRDYDALYHVPHISEDDYAVHLDSNLHGLYEKFSLFSKRESLRSDTVEMSIYPAERSTILDILKWKKFEGLSQKDSGRIDVLARDFGTYYDKADKALNSSESEGKGIRNRFKKVWGKFKEES